MIALLVSVALAAGGVDAHGFTEAPSDGGITAPLAVWRAEAARPKVLNASGLFEYADSPLVFYYPDGTHEALVDHVAALNLGFYAGLHKRVSATLSLPLILTSGGVDGNAGPTFADARLSVPVSLLAPTDGDLFVSVVPYVDVPTGSRQRFLGAGGLGGGALVAARLNVGALEADANVGAGVASGAAVENLRGGFNGQLGGALAYAVNEDLGLRGELVWKPHFNDNPVAGTESPGEALLSVRGRQERLSWTVGAAKSITGGAGAARFRLFLGVGFTIPEPKDTDQDGLIDKVDACVDVPETVNGWKDSDGCADALADVQLHVVDPRGAAVPNANVTLGEESFVTDASGDVRLLGRTPESALSGGEVSLDTYVTTPFAGGALVEGANNYEVSLPWKPASLTVHAVGVDHDGGKTPLDAELLVQGEQPITTRLGEDGTETLALPANQSFVLIVQQDGWFPVRRELTTAPGAPVAFDVELKTAKAIIRAEGIEILEQVNFDTGKATIKPDSFGLLDQVGQILIDHPSVRRVEVQGHTDDRGNDASNLKLSQQRVESVVAYLVTNGGLDPARLVAVGYGEGKPLVPNSSEANRALNRRVQFVILEQGDKPVVAPAPEPSPAP